MPTFPTKKFRPSSYRTTLPAWYRHSLTHSPFLFFGLPFILTIVAGSFFLVPATALRYEHHDRKTQQIGEEERLGLGKGRRRVDAREEYWRLASKDVDNWENKRVKRLKGEIDGVLEGGDGGG